MLTYTKSKANRREIGVKRYVFVLTLNLRTIRIEIKRLNSFSTGVVQIRLNYLASNKNKNTTLIICLNFRNENSM